LSAFKVEEDINLTLGINVLFINRHIILHGVLPKIVPRGAKNMSIEVPSCNIRMIDSINFLPMALSKLPKMFGIKELQKGREQPFTKIIGCIHSTKFDLILSTYSTFALWSDILAQTFKAYLMDNTGTFEILSVGCRYS
jgi:hypothetical protein